MGARSGGGGGGRRGAAGGGTNAAGRSVDSIRGKKITLTPKNSKLGNGSLTVTKNSKGEYVFDKTYPAGSSAALHATGSKITQPNAAKAQSWYNMTLSMYKKARI